MEHHPEVSIVYENQRHITGLGWTQQLLPCDRYTWSNEDGSVKYYDVSPFSAWDIYIDDKVDPEGWCYAFHFKDFDEPLSPNVHTSPQKLDCVRRRKWIRVHDMPDSTDGTEYCRKISQPIRKSSADVVPQEIPSSRNPCMNLIQGVCPLPRSECPYYHGVIDPPYPDIILGKSKSGGMSILESATLQRIIERITDPHNTDIVIRNAFLLTYHSYTTTNEILEILEKRSNVAYEYSQLFPSCSNSGCGSGNNSNGNINTSSIISSNTTTTATTTITTTYNNNINPANQITPCSTPTNHIVHYEYSPNLSNKSLESSIASSSLPIVSVFPTRESFLSFDTDQSTMTRGETEFFNDLNDTVSNSVQIRVLSLLLAWIRTSYSEDDFKDEDCRDQLSNFLLQLSDNVSSIRPNITYVIDRFITLCISCGYKIPSILLDYNNRPEIKSDKVIGTPTANGNNNNNNHSLPHTKHKPLLILSEEEKILNCNHQHNNSIGGSIPNLFRSITTLFQERLPFFISYSPIELARFLTIIENQTIKSIEDRDLVLASESEVIRNSNAKSLWNCVELFNKRSRWIQSALLDSNINILKRTKMIINLIHCAEECRLLGNFATVYQIISSLKQPCICLLKTAWSRVPEKDLHLFNELYNIIKAEDNYSAYRLELEKLIDQLYIPALPMLCKDLYTIGHNYPSYHPAYKHLINFHKFRRLFFEVTEFNRVKDMTYPLTRNPEMMNQYLLESQNLIPSNKLWDIAKSIDLHERKAFYNALQASGF